MKREMPSHMRRAVQRIESLAGAVDIAFDVRDARAPIATWCPLVPKILPGVPIVPVLAKADTADRAVTDRWVKHLRREYPVVLTFRPDRPGGPGRFWEEARRAMPQTPGLCKALILGIPNVGKSTLINFIVGHRRARVGARPGVTRELQLMRGPDNLFLYDTPGVLPPAVTTKESNLLLAAVGALQGAFFEQDDAAHYILAMCLKNYAERFARYFKLDAAPETSVGFCEMLARRRGFLLSGGELDLSRACAVILTDFSQGKITGVSLEAPPG